MDHGREEGLMAHIYENHFILMLGIQNKLRRKPQLGLQLSVGGERQAGSGGRVQPLSLLGQLWEAGPWATLS